MGSHYLYLQLRIGSGASFERVYVPLTSPDESLRAATERWLDQQVAGRQRNIAKARGAAEARIEDARICHPTSWYREHGLGAFAPATPGGRMAPRRRRAGA
jgi:hypothetical protein